MPAPMQTGDDPAGRLLSRLEGVKQTGVDRWIARCPAHRDKRPSLSIRQTDDGRLLVHCWAGCSAAEVVHAVGLRLAGLFAAPLAHSHGPLPRRSRWNGPDAWRLIAHEAAVAAVAASDVAAGRPISEDDAARAWLAADRLAEAAGTLGVTP